MKLAVPIVIMAVLAIVALSAERASAAQDDQVYVVIPLKYLSAAVAAQIFGGTVIPASPFVGESIGGARGGYGSHAGGTGIGGARGGARQYGGYGGGYDASGGYGTQSGYDYPR